MHNALHFFAEIVLILVIVNGIESVKRSPFVQYRVIATIASYLLQILGVLVVKFIIR